MYNYHQDELYVANTLQEILHIVKDKYKIKINPHVEQGNPNANPKNGT